VGEQSLTIDDAIAYLIQFARAPRHRGYATYGFEIWLPSVVAEYRIQVNGVPEHDAYRSPAKGPSAIFQDAAWELCRRGVFRPSDIEFQGHQAPDGGNGYSLTAVGKRWLESDPTLLILLQPGHLAQMLGRFAERFGPGFIQRSNEAVRCHGNGTYLACCAMCGAAAESILLATATARRGDADAVLRDYRASGGRSRVEKSLLGQIAEPVAGRFRTFMDLLNYWRDDSSHGVATTIGDIEAYDALSRLVRLAHFATDHWSILTGRQ
jgi:hypothetical protein